MGNVIFSKLRVVFRRPNIEQARFYCSFLQSLASACAVALASSLYLIYTQEEIVIEWWVIACLAICPVLLLVYGSIILKGK